MVQRRRSLVNLKSVSIQEKLQHMVEISNAGNSFTPQGTGNNSCRLKIELLSSGIKYHLNMIYNFINSIKYPLSSDLLSEPFLVRNTCCTILCSAEKDIQLDVLSGLGSGIKHS